MRLNVKGDERLSRGGRGEAENAEKNEATLARDYSDYRRRTKIGSSHAESSLTSAMTRLSATSSERDGFVFRTVMIRFPALRSSSTLFSSHYSSLISARLPPRLRGSA
jgi:hypothetical protein